MNTEHLQFLKEVLSVKTKTYEETQMVAFLTNYFTMKGYDHYVDAKNNVYVTKGRSDFYPCVISHTDTVHAIRPLNVVEKLGRRPRNTFGQEFNDREDRLILTGIDNRGNPSGIGGDDKCGVYVCLRLLEEFDNLKAAFFVSEETGCHGSKVADPLFFSNVAYTIQFDAPGNRLVSEVCWGIRLFERGSRFFELVSSTLSSYDDFLYQEHPYTDVSQIKQKFDHACINLSCGYYYMHSPHEFVDVEDVERTVCIGRDLIQNLGWEKYDYTFDVEEHNRAITEQRKQNEIIWEQQRKKMREEMKKRIEKRFGKEPPDYLQFLLEDEQDEGDFFDDDDWNFN
jgi:tripeptide aminopeptidase